MAPACAGAGGGAFSVGTVFAATGAGFGASGSGAGSSGGGGGGGGGGGRSGAWGRARGALDQLDVVEVGQIAVDTGTGIESAPPHAVGQVRGLCSARGM